RNSALVTPAFRWFSRASASISGVRLSPYALPLGPTRRAERSTSMPPPEPRSSTTSPSWSSASAVGLPQPSDARTASAGSAAVSPWGYRLEVIGSGADPQQPVPHGSGAPPAATRRAISPYFARTVSRRSDPLMGPS